MPTRENALSKNFSLFHPTSNNDREPENLTGRRCFSVAHRWKGGRDRFSSPDALHVLGDSGAFSHNPDSRWTFPQHLEKVFEWERNFERAQGWETGAFQFAAVASYDVLIDETWVDGDRVKQRWSVAQAQKAVRDTVAAAQYLSEQRHRLGDRKLLLGCQGVTPQQYARCVEQICAVARPQDWIGLGGWCILGRQQHLLPEFEKTLNLIMPLLARRISRVHLFGVLWTPALDLFGEACDRFGLQGSTDSVRPIRDCANPKPAALRKAAAKAHYWRDSVEWWRQKVEQ